MRNKGTRPVSEVLDDYFGRHGLIRRVQQASVVNDWERLVGPLVAKVTAPQSVDRDGTLRVRVQSPAWMQELQLMSPTIIRELAQQGRRIKRIRWMLGTVGEQSVTAGGEHVAAGRRPWQKRTRYDG